MPRPVLPILLLLLVAGCGDREPPPPADSGSGPVAGGTAVVALAGEPDILNPLIRTSADAGLILAELLAATTEMADDLSFVPSIASRWEIDPDGLGITYHLRPWRWADGRDVTARDFAVTMGLILDPRVASPRRGAFGDVASAVALDDSTLRYTFSGPVADPLVATFHLPVPAHVVATLDPAKVGDWALNTAPLANGPFSLESWERNRQLTLVRNGRYSGTAANLERVVFRILPESETRILALEAGEVDLVGQLPATAARRLRDGGEVRVVAIGGRHLYYLQWNLARTALADAATRRALSAALDRGRMVESLLLGFGRAATSPIAPALWNHHRELAPDAYDPPAARAMLATAGWRDDDGDGRLERDGVPLRLEILTRQGDPVRENGAVILADNLRAVGAEVTLRTLELGAALDLLRAGRFDAYYGLLNLNLWGDPSAYVHSTATDRLNQGGYANARVDSLLEAALALDDRAAALPLWLDLQQELAADQPAAYLFYPEILVGVGPRLRGVRPHMLSPVNNLSEWWIPTDRRRYRDGS